MVNHGAMQEDVLLSRRQAGYRELGSDSGTAARQLRKETASIPLAARRRPRKEERDSPGQQTQA